MPASPNGQVQGVLFDWDGTLLNSYRADSSAYLAMFRQMGIPWTLDDLARHYSPTGIASIAPQNCLARAGTMLTASGANTTQRIAQN